MKGGDLPFALLNLGVITFSYVQYRDDDMFLQEHFGATRPTRVFTRPSGTSYTAHPRPE